MATLGDQHTDTRYRVVKPPREEGQCEHQWEDSCFFRSSGNPETLRANLKFLHAGVGALLPRILPWVTAVVLRQNLSGPVQYGSHQPRGALKSKPIKIKS